MERPTNTPNGDSNNILDADAKVNQTIVTGKELEELMKKTTDCRVLVFEKLERNLSDEARDMIIECTACEIVPRNRVNEGIRAEKQESPLQPKEAFIIEANGEIVRVDTDGKPQVVTPKELNENQTKARKAQDVIDNAAKKYDINNNAVKDGATSRDD